MENLSSRFMLRTKSLITFSRNGLRNHFYYVRDFTGNPINDSEGMADDQKDRLIQYLAEQHQEDELTIKAIKLVLEDFMKNQKSLDEQMASFQWKLQKMEDKHRELQRELSEERKKRKSAERNARNLQEQLDYARQEQFGDRRQRLRERDKSGKPAPAEPDRQDEKDKYDGTDIGSGKRSLLT